MRGLSSLVGIGCMLAAGCTVPEVPDSEIRQAAPNECVVLLHGLARSNYSMLKLVAELQQANYSFVNIDYPSTEQTIEELADEYVPQGIQQCRDTGAQKIHFIAHSMSGIMLRYYLSDREIAELGRVVMIAPPNKGSEVVDEMFDVPGFEALNGPAGYQLGTGENSLPLKLGPANFEVGIIAGSLSFNPVYSGMLPGDDDGKVTVESTRLDGMLDFIVVPQTHAFIMRNEEVIDQAIYFIQNGQFHRVEPVCAEGTDCQ